MDYQAAKVRIMTSTNTHLCSSMTRRSTHPSPPLPRSSRSPSSPTSPSSSSPQLSPSPFTFPRQSLPPHPRPHLTPSTASQKTPSPSARPPSQAPPASSPASASSPCSAPPAYTSSTRTRSVVDPPPVLARRALHRCFRYRSKRRVGHAQSRIQSTLRPRSAAVHVHIKFHTLVISPERPRTCISLEYACRFPHDGHFSETCVRAVLVFVPAGHTLDTHQSPLVALRVLLRLRLAFLPQCARERVWVRPRRDLDVFVCCVVQTGSEEGTAVRQVRANVQLAGSSCPHCSQVTIVSPSCGSERSVPQVGQKRREPVAG